MRPETLQLFSQLCEGIVFEASSSMSFVSGLPGGPQVVQFLHQNKGLGHDQEYQETGKISWSQLKDYSRGGWVLMKYPKGTGAIKQTSGSYEAVASTGGDPTTFTNDRGGNILDFLKGQLGGNPKAMWIGRDSGGTKELTRKRSSARAELDKVATVSQETLLKKFKPLWIKAITVAHADIKGHIVNMIKNDAFGKAEKKLRQLSVLDDGIAALEAGNDPPGFLSGAVSQAVHLSAAHYYPEQTGEISRGYGGGWNSLSDEGTRLLLKDIANGDQAKLGTVLSFFKRSLISG